MIRKTIAIVLFAAGALLPVVLTLIHNKGIAWPTSVVLFVVGGGLWWSARPKPQPVYAPDMRPGEVPVSQGYSVPPQTKATVLIDKMIDRTLVHLIPAHAEKAVGWPILVAIVMGGLGLFFGGIAADLTRNPLWLVFWGVLGFAPAFLSSRILNKDPRGEVFATRLNVTDAYIEARDAEGEMHMYQKGKIDRLTKEPVYLSELGKHKIQQDRFDWYAKYSFALFITYEGKKIAIASGLDAPVAETAFQAVCKQLDFS